MGEDLEATEYGDDMKNPTMVYKVLRRTKEGLKSAIIGDKPASAVQQHAWKFRKHELAYPVGALLRRRSLAFSSQEQATKWMKLMYYKGCDFEVWSASTSGAVAIHFVAQLEKLTVDQFKAVVACKDFFTRSVQWRLPQIGRFRGHGRSWYGTVTVSGMKIAVCRFERGAMRCRDLCLIERVNGMQSGLSRDD